MSKHRASTAVTALDSFDSRTAGEHDPGQIIILFDHRHILPRPEDNKMSSYQTYYLDGLSRMGWATYWEKPILDPGKIQLVWYTVGLNPSLLSTPDIVKPSAHTASGNQRVTQIDH